MFKNTLACRSFLTYMLQKSKKTLPLSRNRYIKLSWNRKNLDRQRGFGPVSSSLGRCMLNIHAYVLNIHACSTYMHTYMLNIHAYIHTYSTHARHTYVFIYVCMYLCNVMYVCILVLIQYLALYLFEIFKNRWVPLVSVDRELQKPSQAEGFCRHTRLALDFREGANRCYVFVCMFKIHDRQRVFKHTYMLKSFLFRILL